MLARAFDDVAIAIASEGGTARIGVTRRRRGLAGHIHPPAVWRTTAETRLSVRRSAPAARAEAASPSTRPAHPPSAIRLSWIASSAAPCLVIAEAPPRRQPV